MASNLIELVQLIFTLVILCLVGAVCVWGSLKLARHISATRRDNAMKEQALVAGARHRALQRAAASRLA